MGNAYANVARRYKIADEVRSQRTRLLADIQDLNATHEVVDEEHCPTCGKILLVQRRAWRHLFPYSRSLRLVHVSNAAATCRRWGNSQRCRLWTWWTQRSLSL